MSHNEADTRAKLIDRTLHACQWVELVKEEQRSDHGEIHREQSAVRIDILDGKPLKRGRGRVDYLLRVYLEAYELLRQCLIAAPGSMQLDHLPPTGSMTSTGRSSAS